MYLYSAFKHTTYVFEMTEHLTIQKVMSVHEYAILNKLDLHIVWHSLAIGSLKCEPNPWKRAQWVIFVVITRYFNN